MIYVTDTNCPFEHRSEAIWEKGKKNKLLKKLFFFFHEKILEEVVSQD